MVGYFSFSVFLEQTSALLWNSLGQWRMKRSNETQECFGNNYVIIYGNYVVIYGIIIYKN